MLDTPHFEWKNDAIIAGDSCIDPETKQIAISKLMDSKTWCSFGATMEEAESALKSEIIDDILNKHPEMALVVSNSYMEPFMTHSKIGFAAGFTGGFVENPREA